MSCAGRSGQACRGIGRWSFARTQKSQPATGQTSCERSRADQASRLQLKSTSAWRFRSLTRGVTYPTSDKACLARTRQGTAVRTTIHPNQRREVHRCLRFRSACVRDVPESHLARDGRCINRHPGYTLREVRRCLAAYGVTSQGEGSFLW